MTEDQRIRWNRMAVAHTKAIAALKGIRDLDGCSHSVHIASAALTELESPEPVVDADQADPRPTSNPEG